MPSKSKLSLSLRPRQEFAAHALSKADRGACREGGGRACDPRAKAAFDEVAEAQDAPAGRSTVGLNVQAADHGA